MIADNLLKRLAATENHKKRTSSVDEPTTHDSKRPRIGDNADESETQISDSEDDTSQDFDERSATSCPSQRVIQAKADLKETLRGVHGNWESYEAECKAKLAIRQDMLAQLESLKSRCEASNSPTAAEIRQNLLLEEHGWAAEVIQCVVDQTNAIAMVINHMRDMYDKQVTASQTKLARAAEQTTKMETLIGDLWTTIVRSGPVLLEKQ